MRKPTSAVMGSACAPMRNRLPEKSRQGILRGTSSTARPSNASCPSRAMKSRSCASAASTPAPSASNCAASEVRRGAAACAGASATRSSTACCASLVCTACGQRRPQCCHSSSAPKWSSAGAPRTSHVASAGAARSARRTLRHTRRCPSCCAVHCPRSATAAAPSGRRSIVRLGASSVMEECKGGKKAAMVVPCRQTLECVHGQGRVLCN